MFRFTAGSKVSELACRILPGEHKEFERALAQYSAAAPEGLKLGIEAREVDTQPEYDDVATLEATLNDEAGEQRVVVTVPTRGGDHVEFTELELGFCVLEGRRRGDIYWTARD